MHTDVKKTGVVERERGSHSKSRSRSHHVEVVLARIFAKQRRYSKTSLRDIDLENRGAEWR